MVVVSISVYPIRLATMHSKFVAKEDEFYVIAKTRHFYCSDF